MGGNINFVYTTIAICEDGDVRVIGNSSRSGRVEVCFSETWGTICNGQWTSNDAKVVCRQLGWSRFGESMNL